ncbi:MAG: hypothetical protein SGCHY_005462 [Lobulomycetales sp.]
MIAAAARSKADSYVFDLEDSVTIAQKPNARALVTKALSEARSTHAFVCARINSVGSGFCSDDLAAILPRESHIDAIVMPKVDSVEDIEYVSRYLDASTRPVSSATPLNKLEPMNALLGSSLLQSIAAPLDFNLLRDYCADVGITRTPSRTELLYARQHVVTAAVANGVQAIDLVCVEYTNDQVLQEECLEGATWGFTGKQVIHPRQVEIVNAAFSPSQSSIDWAQRIMKGVQEAGGRGRGAFTLDGKMVDEPVVKQAMRILNREQIQ